MVADDITGVLFLDGPGRREAARHKLDKESSAHCTELNGRHEKKEEEAACLSNKIRSFGAEHAVKLPRQVPRYP